LLRWRDWHLGRSISIRHYGTALAPLLLLLGFTPIQIVPTVLLSEFVTGVSAGIAHHSLGNVDLGRGSKARKVTWILSGCSVIGGDMDGQTPARQEPPPLHRRRHHPSRDPDAG